VFGGWSALPIRSKQRGQTRFYPEYAQQNE